MKAGFSSGILLLLVSFALPAAGNDNRSTVVYDDKATDVTAAQTQDGAGSFGSPPRILRGPLGLK